MRTTANEMYDVLESLSYQEILRLLSDLMANLNRGIYVPEKKEELEDKILSVRAYLTHSRRFQ